MSMSKSDTKTTFDVDIDVYQCDKKRYGTRSMIYNLDNEKVLPHPSGVYTEDVPVDELTGLCAFDYKHGESKGFQKVDLLNNTSYKIFRDKKDVIMHSEMDIDWDVFLDEEFVEQLPHLGKNVDLVKKTKPRCVEDLADVLALIRPGKIHLIGSYLTDKESTRLNLYKRPKTGVFFKKSHAIGYALMIKTIVSKKLNSSGISW